jgi:hypothetical protein
MVYIGEWELERKKKLFLAVSSVFLYKNLNVHIFMIYLALLASQKIKMLLC